jgi:hypothetical protein
MLTQSLKMIEIGQYPPIFTRDILLFMLLFIAVQETVVTMSTNVIHKLLLVLVKKESIDKLLIIIN